MARTKSSSTANGKGQGGGQQAIYQMVTDRILKLLDAGTVPWVKPWVSSNGDFLGQPSNYKTGYEYRGANIFLTAFSGFDYPWWLTLNQTQELGGRIKREEFKDSTPIVFYRNFFIRKSDSSRLNPGEEQNYAPNEVERRFFLNYYKVWNVEQTEGIDYQARALPPVSDKKFDRIHACDQIIDRMPNRPRIRHSGSRACYSPVQDLVSMPPEVDFKTPELYYSTKFHELVHSTGHMNRLGRRKQWGSFGDDLYSEEELVAEIGSAFLCGVVGITPAKVEAIEKKGGKKQVTLLDHSASYVDHWRKKLGSDPRFILIAAQQAQKAADYIQGITYENHEAMAA